ncbi:MAG: hypothetical protein KGL46_02595 [Hyphomicrobiales bacterium]|nr:hypothetical protein [Hyphomicrobiales bacterium]
MSDNNNSGGGMGLLGVLIGALIVVGIGYMLLQNGSIGGPKKVDVKIQAPAVTAPAAPASK